MTIDENVWRLIRVKVVLFSCVYLKKSENSRIQDYDIPVTRFWCGVDVFISCDPTGLHKILPPFCSGRISYCGVFYFDMDDCATLHPRSLSLSLSFPASPSLFACGASWIWKIGWTVVGTKLNSILPWQWTFIGRLQTMKLFYGHEQGSYDVVFMLHGQYWFWQSPKNSFMPMNLCNKQTNICMILIPFIKSTSTIQITLILIPQTFWHKMVAVSRTLVH